jgi:hypothetical protein
VAKVHLDSPVAVMAGRFANKATVFADDKQGGKKTRRDGAERRMA